MRNAINLLIVIVGVCLGLAPLRAQEYPDFRWSYLKNPIEKGWNQTKLDQLHQYLIDSTAITGYMIIYEEKVLFAYGDILSLL